MNQPVSNPYDLQTDDHKAEDILICAVADYNKHKKILESCGNPAAQKEE